MAVIDLSGGRCVLEHHTIRSDGKVADSKHFQPGDLEDIKEWRSMIDRRPFRHCFSHSDAFHDRMESLSGITQPQYNASRKRAWILATSWHEAMVMHALFLARTDSKILEEFIDRNFWDPYCDYFRMIEEIVLNSDVPACPVAAVNRGRL